MATAVRPLRKTRELATMDPAEEAAIDTALASFKRQGMGDRLMVFRSHDDGYGDRCTLELRAEPGLPYARTMRGVDKLPTGPEVVYTGFKLGSGGLREPCWACVDVPGCPPATMDPAEVAAIDQVLALFEELGVADRLWVLRRHDDGYGGRYTSELSAEPGLPYTRTLTSVHELMTGPGVIYSGFQVGLDGLREASRSCIHRWCDD